MKKFDKNQELQYRRVPSTRTFALVIVFSVFQLFAISPPINIAAWGDSLTQGGGGTPYPTKLSSLSGHFIYNGGVGGETSTQIKTRFDADPAKHSWATIIWAGRNNFGTPSQVKADIAAMVASLGHNQYLVLSILNASNDSLPEYNTIIQLNNDLAALYGSHYVDIRSHLVSLYNPADPQDSIDRARDVPPSSLRADHIHLNTAGYEAVAQKIYNDHMSVLEGTAGSLPLKLINFTADKSGSANLLQWTTAEERNSSHTEIERSMDGVSFSVIGNVPGNTNGSANSYSYTDTKPLEGKNFYRLKLIDKDGKFVYSGVVTVLNVSGFRINLVTNPVKENLTLKISSEKRADIILIIMSSTGRELKRTNFTVLPGVEIKNFNVSPLSRGNYFLRIITAEKGSSSFQFMKLAS